MSIAPTLPAEQQPGLVRRALAGHGALGLLAAGLLYLVALTGTLAVIHDRWQRWEQPDVPEYNHLSPDAVQAAMAAALAPAPGKPPPTLVTVQMPGPDLPRGLVTTGAGSWSIDAAGRLGPPVEVPWTQFVVALHETLLLPALWGYLLVGALGVALAALAVTGVLAHPRIVRDAFRLRWRQGPHIARVDWHNRLGVWTLPFTLTLALSGAALGLGSLGFSLLANAYYGGSLAAAYAPVFGAQPPAGTGAAPAPAAAARALRVVGTIAPAMRPVSLSAQAAGPDGRAIQILALPPRRLIYGESYWFDARGRLLGRAGLSDGPPAQQAAVSLYGLHFGNAGGLAVELAYLVFGAALCAVIATGPSIWLHKRSRRGLASPRLSACWIAVVWGMPLLLVLALWLRAGAGAGAPLGPFFWGGAAALLAMAVVAPGWFTPLRGRSVLFGAVAATGAAHLLVVRPEAVGAQVIDLVACLGSGVTLWTVRRFFTGPFRRRRAPAG